MISLASITASAESANTWNLRTSPVSWVVGPNLRLDLRASDSWTVGVTGNYFDTKLKAVNLTGNNGGVVATYNFSGTFSDSWYLEGGVAYGDLQASTSADTLHLTNWSGRIYGGYHWFWTHFNLSLGAGVNLNSAGGKQILDSTGNQVKVPIYPATGAVDVAIGLAF
jgi:hypothetical protein